MPPAANPDSAERRAALRTWAWIAAAWLGIVLLVTICVLPNFLIGRKAARYGRDMARLRTIRSALLAYTDRHGSLPPHDSDWPAVLLSEGLVTPDDLDLETDDVDGPNFTLDPGAQFGGPTDPILLRTGPLPDGRRYAVHAYGTTTIIPAPVESQPHADSSP